MSSGGWANHLSASSFWLCLRVLYYVVDRLVFNIWRCFKETLPVINIIRCSVGLNTKVVSNISVYIILFSALT